MTNKIRQDPITGHVRQSLLDVLFGIPIGYSLFIFMAVFLPQYNADKKFLYITLAIGITGIGASIWLNSRPNLWAKLIKLISLSILWTIIACRVFGYFFPSFPTLFQALIILTVTVSYIIPIWNPNLTQFIRTELNSPKTNMGRLLLGFAFALMPLSGAIGAGLQLLNQHSLDKVFYTALILGPLCWFLALLMPFATQHPISPWEYHQQKKTDAK